MRCRRNSEDAGSRGGEGVQVGLNHPKKWTVNKRSEQENTDRVEWAETRTRVSGDRREAARLKRNVHTMARFTALAIFWILFCVCPESWQLLLVPSPSGCFKIFSPAAMNGLESVALTKRQEYGVHFTTPSSLKKT